jgi:hypothetical protein
VERRDHLEEVDIYARDDIKMGFKKCAVNICPIYWVNPLKPELI